MRVSLMKVSELIAKLEEFRSDREVFIPDNESGLDHSPVEDVNVEDGHISSVESAGYVWRSFRPAQAAQSGCRVGPTNAVVIVLR
jgi:hypothetical protein